MPAPAVFVIPAFVVEYIATAPARSYMAPAPVVYATPVPVGFHRVRCTSVSGRVHHALAVIATPAPLIEHIAPTSAVSYVAPARYAAPPPLVEYIAPARAVIATRAPVLEYIAPTKAISFMAPAPDVYTAPAPVYITRAPEVIAALAFVVEYIATEPALSYVVPASTVYAAPVPVVEYARGGVHRARACRVRDTSTRGREPRASVSRLLRGASSSCARCDSICGGVHCASASSVLHSTSSSCACRACANCGAHRASTSGSVAKASGIKQTQHSDFVTLTPTVQPRRSCSSSPSTG